MTFTYFPLNPDQNGKEANKNKACSLVLSTVAAGFPSPADDHLDDVLDLNELLIKRPASTFHVRVSGQSMRGAGILENDILVVDRAETALTGSVVVAAVDGECLVKFLQEINGRKCLKSANPKYPPLFLEEGMEFQIWGVVVGVVRKHGNHGRVCSN